MSASAALQMNQDVGLSSAAFGFGAGLFFVAYCLFAVPCNLLMVRIGARRWLSIVMIAWGIISALMALVSGPHSFYALRFLLGDCRGRVLPRGHLLPDPVVSLAPSQPDGCHPDDGRCRCPACLARRYRPHCCSRMAGSACAAGTALFILEGVPAILLGLGCALVLPRSIRDAKFLREDQKVWLEAEIARKPEEGIIDGSLSLWQVLINKYVLLLTLVYIGGHLRHQRAVALAAADHQDVQPEHHAGWAAELAAVPDRQRGDVFLGVALRPHRGAHAAHGNPTGLGHAGA